MPLAFAPWAGHGFAVIASGNIFCPAAQSSGVRPCVGRTSLALATSAWVLLSLSALAPVRKCPVLVLSRRPLVSLLASSMGVAYLVALPAP